MPRDWEADYEDVSIADVITNLNNQLAAEKAINAALNAQIESIQQENNAQIDYLEEQNGRYKHVNKMQAEAINRLNERVKNAEQNEKANDVMSKAAYDELGASRDRLLQSNEDLRYRLRTIRDRVDSMTKDV